MFQQQGLEKMLTLVSTGRKAFRITSLCVFQHNSHNTGTFRYSLQELQADICISPELFCTNKSWIFLQPEQRDVVLKQVGNY